MPLIYLESNAVILHNFWGPQPTLPCFRLQYSISKKTRTTVSLSSMQQVFAESSLRKQAWRNPKEGRVVCLHQNIFTRKVTHLPPTFAIIIHIPRPLRPCIWRPRVPASPSQTSPRPILDVLKSLVSRPQVPSPPTGVPMSPSHFYTQPIAMRCGCKIFKMAAKVEKFRRLYALFFNRCISFLRSFFSIS